MTCQTCISWKRTFQTYGECFHSAAIVEHLGEPGDRMGAAEGHTCRHHANRALMVEAIEERAAIMEYDGGLDRAIADTMAAENVRSVMFREGKAR